MNIPKEFLNKNSLFVLIVCFRLCQNLHIDDRMMTLYNIRSVTAIERSFYQYRPVGILSFINKTYFAMYKIIYKYYLIK